MKKIYIFIQLYVLANCVNAQWSQINTGSADNYFHVSFINDSTGMLVSSQTILLSENHGNSWDTAYFNTDDLISDAQFLNDSTIFFVGYSPTSGNSFLKKTFNLGNSWSTTNSVGNGQIFFTSLDTGHLFGDGGTLRTIDGGIGWAGTALNPSNISFVAGNIYFTSASTGYFVGWYNFVIYKTIDSGASWDRLTNIPTNTDAGLDIHFPSSEVGYSCGHDGTIILKTLDGGVNWTTLSTGIAGFSTLNSIYCSDNNNCYSMGENGTIIKTVDGGSTWQQEISGTTENLKSVYCTNQYCYAVGNNGTVLRTANTLNTIDEPKKKENIKIYPNPANEELRIESALGTIIQSIKLLDINGKVVKNYSSKISNINISELASGHYVLKVTTDKGVFTEKIIKQQ